jgi:hypothetical protein
MMSAARYRHYHPGENPIGKTAVSLVPPATPGPEG